MIVYLNVLINTLTSKGSQYFKLALFVHLTTLILTQTHKHKKCKFILFSNNDKKDNRLLL